MGKITAATLFMRCGNDGSLSRDNEQITGGAQYASKWSAIEMK